MPGVLEDFQSAAFLALVEAAQSFDPERNVGFASFARHHIRGALFDLRRETMSRKDPLREERPRPAPSAGEAAESNGRIHNARPERPVGANLEVHDTVENWIRKLPRPHSQAFRHIYMEGKTQEEAALLVGCSRSRLSRMHGQALSWIQQACELDRHA